MAFGLWITGRERKEEREQAEEHTYGILRLFSGQHFSSSRGKESREKNQCNSGALLSSLHGIKAEKSTMWPPRKGTPELVKPTMTSQEGMHPSALKSGFPSPHSITILLLLFLSPTPKENKCLSYLMDFQGKPSQR